MTTPSDKLNKLKAAFNALVEGLPEECATIQRGLQIQRIDTAIDALTVPETQPISQKWAASQPRRALLSTDSYCPSCGHNRDASAVSSIDNDDGTHYCQKCSAEWVEDRYLTAPVSASQTRNKTEPVARTPLEIVEEWKDWIPYPDSTAAEWDRYNLAAYIARSTSGEPSEPQHVCGLQGYDPMIDAPCPGCEARSASGARE